jgi:hypothetical protein
MKHTAPSPSDANSDSHPPARLSRDTSLHLQVQKDDYGYRHSAGDIV